MYRARTNAALALLAVAAALAVAPPARAAPDAGPDDDSHAGHRHHAGAPLAPARSVAVHVVPRVALVRHDGRRAELPADMDDGRPVFLNFVYTTCTAICLPMSQVFSEFQAKLGAERTRVRMVSISIDPEQDTPRRLDEYARRFGAGDQWTFYTGTVEASVALQKAFAAYRGDKMNHTPLTFVRPAPGQPWVRLDGFATPDQLLHEYRLAAAAAR